jgi:outer membrane biogenesis lipoprotein LolB
MKKLFLGLSLVALLAGCASHKSDNGMGGTSDQYNQSEQSDTSSSSDQFNNNATHGTGTSTATNSANGQGMSQ